MTKQEEIRKEIASLTYQSCIDAGHKPRKESDYLPLADELLSYLYSQGAVVIKVKRELPEYAPFPERNPKPIEGAAFLLGMDIGREDMLKAGYVAVEPLIEE